MSEGGSKNAFSWLEFNEWARNVREITGKRPGVRAIRAWWDENAERAWPESSTRPTYDDAKRHAKGLRSKQAIRVYFREYRARHKAGSSRSRKLAARKAKTGGRDDTSDDDKNDRHTDAGGNEPPPQADGSGGEQHHGTAAPVSTLPTRQSTRPPRVRRTPERFRSGVVTVFGSPSNSGRSGSLRSDIDDGGSDSDAHASSDDDAVIVDGKTQHTRSRRQPARRQPQQPQTSSADSPSAAVASSGQKGATPPPDHRPSLQKPTPAEREGASLATRKAMKILAAAAPRHKASAQAVAGPWQAADGADAVNPAILLRFLATGGAPPLHPSTVSPPLPVGSMLPETLDLLGPPPQSAPLQRYLHSTNMGQGAPSDTTAEQRAGFLQQGVSASNLPTPGAMERGFVGYAQPGAAAAPPPPSLLRRRPLAPLSSAQCATLFGYEAAVNVHGSTVRPRGARVASHAAAAFVSGVKMPAEEHLGDDGQLPRETPNVRKRIGVAGGEQPPAKKAADALQDIAEDPASTRRASAGTSGFANARTPANPQRKGPQTGQIAEPSPNDATGGAGVDPASILRLGSIVGSAFKPFMGLDMALGLTGQDAEYDNWSAGTPSIAAGASAAAASGLAGGDRGRETAVDGEWNGGGFFGGGQQVLGGMLGGQQQQQQLILSHQAALVHVKQEPGHAGPGQMWVPVEDPTSNPYSNPYNNMYGNPYGYAYDPAVAFQGTGALPQLHYAGSTPYRLQQQKLLSQQPTQQQMFYTVPPSDHQNTAVPPNLPAALGGAWPAAPMSYQTWQYASGGLYAGAPLLGDYDGYSAYGGYGGLPPTVGGVRVQQGAGDAYL